ncbi:MAG: SH3 domain-containing protein [Paracoccaceae bacterium]|nr:SH3 domain-containing protein [Paracoccaceae bacterium]
MNRAAAAWTTGLVVCLHSVLTVPAGAESAVSAATATDIVVAAADAVGPVTGYPLPRFVSMKSSIGNARRGPGFSYRVDWVFNHTGTPLLITAEHGHWRRVEDIDGMGGWMHFRLLSGIRTVVHRESETAIRDRPDNDGRVNAFADRGVISRLDRCTSDWCRIYGDGYSGWVLKEEIFGVFPDEAED